MYKQIILRKNKEESLLRRHPWVFSGAIDLIDDEISDGDIVSVFDSRNKFLASGHFQNATIAVRILTFEEIELNQSFYNQVLSEAIELRKTLGLFSKENSICRILHGEGDGLPGLIIDYYNGVAVIQCHSIGMYQSIELISVALQTVLGKSLKAVYSKSSETLHNKADIVDSFIFGTCKTPHKAKENGIIFSIDWVTGQKTGFFIDQRENRKLLSKYAQNKKILNTFCYSGGFSLSALKAGANEVHSLDSSKKAIELTEQNVGLNKLEENHVTIVADAMEFMKTVDNTFDVIILDPPAFAKHRDKRHQAIQGYKRLNEMAIRSIRPGGIIFTFSCSQVVDKNLFTHTVIAAAISSGRKIRILEQLHQPADHPINAFHPEGEYLKGLVIQVS
ncbi:MAG: class I SAM-dependent rRNA methyltransferase [Crocinitomicaceae bacterium]|nr:class I SAM-dependent rRNA methyltransferase [Crocinitomicaceae bacterium]MCF8444513.1 class I SAM-dependent rRNA methyltransferase [Crocinitomicaceae bacterium]